MFPSHTNSEAEIQIPAVLPENLRMAIRDAEDCYRAGLYSPTVQAAGRALEGLLKHSLNERQGNLHNLIEKFCESKEVVEPIKILAHTMREGRNVASHFDETVTPDQESAEIMLKMLNYLISYLYLFGEQAEKLGHKLNRTLRCSSLYRKLVRGSSPQNATH